VQDLYIERILDGRDAEYEGAREPLRLREEVIRVKGAADVRIIAGPRGMVRSSTI
jgi:hypothetical protein